LSVRRVQQIVREELDRRDSNPAEDYALMQIARLERALDLLGSQIDAGKPAAVHGFVRVLDHLNRLAPQGLRRRPAIIKQLGDADMMAERLVRLDAARESLALREAERKSQRPADEAKPNPPQVLENKGTGETADVAPSMISEA
jgi:hypothetical protein